MRNSIRGGVPAMLLALIAVFGVAPALGAAEPAADERIRWLRTEIARHDELYFKKVEPEITDFAYDELKRELAALEGGDAGRDVVAAVGDDRAGGFSTYRHRAPMLGLQKSRTEAELRAYLQKIAGQLGGGDPVYLVEPKFDGLAISVTYERGRMVRAVTRGNGSEGDDVTANVATIRGLLPGLKPAGTGGGPNPVPEIVELRGEVYVNLAEFARINRERESAGIVPFSHPRTLAAGTLKSRNPDEVAARKLEIAFYGWGDWVPASSAPASQREFHQQVRDWGLPEISSYRVAGTPDAVWSTIQAFGGDRRGFGYPTDGMVVKLDSVELRRRVGTGDDAPRWALAYKFAPERAVTRLQAIRLQVGRTGALTPVAELDPVQLNGTTVSRASLHNREQIARADFRIGDYVWVEKAGEIIPQLTGVDLSRRTPGLPPYEFPKDCPVCRADLVQPAGEAAIRCSNSACPAVVRRRVEHFASKACVAIEGLGPVTIDALVEAGRLRNVADIYRLTRDDVLAAPRTGGRSAERLLNAIEESKRAELWRFVYGLGIPGVGPANAKVLARHWGTLDALPGASRAGTGGADGRPISGVGESVAASVMDYFESPGNRAIVAELLAAGVQPAAK